MTAWEKIKLEMTKHTHPGSAGYSVGVIHASDVFVAIIPHLKDNQVEQDAFNADKEVTEAIMLRKDFIAIGLIKG